MIEPNKIELALKDFLNKKFRNYLIFRETFLIPLRGLPINPNWRNDTHPLLEQLGVTSYGILKSMNFIIHRKRLVNISDFDQSFKNIYFHFGLIFDCVESLSRIIVLLQKHFQLIDIDEDLKIPKDKLHEVFSKWVDDEYEIRYKEMIDKGKPIFYFPQRNHTFLSKLITNPLKRNYNMFATEIKNYRNYFIHNPGVDVFKTPTGELFAIKKEYVDRTNNWSNMQVLFIRNRKQFEDPLLMIEKDLNSLVALLNDIWVHFNNKLQQIFTQDGFEKIFRNYPRAVE